MHVPSNHSVLRPWFSNLTAHQNLLENSLKQIAIPVPRVSNSVCLWWGPNICIINKIPGEPESPGTAPHFENHCSGETLKHGNNEFLYKNVHSSIFLLIAKNGNNPNTHGRENKKVNGNMFIKYYRAVKVNEPQLCTPNCMSVI